MLVCEIHIAAIHSHDKTDEKRAMKRMKIDSSYEKRSMSLTTVDK